MTLFRYSALQPDGTEKRSEIEADTQDDAARVILQSGLRPFKVEEIAGTTGRTGGSAAAAKSKLKMSRLFGSLHILLQAGLTIDAALKTASLSEPRKQDRVVLSEIHNAMASGQAFSGALSDRVSVPPSVVAILVAGENSARMAETVGAVVEIYAEKERRRNDTLGAALYPAILMLVLLGALGVVTFVLVPAIEPVFEGAGAPLPFFIGILSGLRAFFRDHEATMVLLTIVGLLVGVVMSRSKAGRRYVSGLVLRIPLIGRVIRLRGSASYLKTLSLLLANGVRLNDALHLAAEAMPVESFVAALRTMRDGVLTGLSFHQAATQASILDPISLSFIKVGEESNSLPVALSRAAALLDMQAKRTSDRIATLMTPAITVVMGLGVGGVVISVMDALLSINDLALQ